jgi:hypothetical protein
MNKRNLLILLLFTSLSDVFCQRKLPKDINADPFASLPSPIVRWDFNNDHRDADGLVESRLIGDAKIKDGYLVLESDGSYLKTDSLPRRVSEKTFVAQVLLTDIEQRGGGVVTIQSLNGATFDSLVFAELKPRTWMNGSEYFTRTKGDEGQEEKDAIKKIHLAITYSKKGEIRIYRNGVPYRSPYQTKTPLQVFRKKDSNILIGRRHEEGANPQFKGKIDFVEIYDEVLSQDEIKKLFAATSQNK